MDVEENEEIEEVQEHEEEIGKKSEKTEAEILKDLKEDLDEAKQAKTQIDKKIADWLALYDGETLGNEVDGRSKFVIKDAKKAVNWIVPNILKPFLSTQDMVKTMPSSSDDVEKAKVWEQLLNFQFVRRFDRTNFLNDTIKKMAKEGTCIVMTGWELKEEQTKTPFEQMTGEEISVMKENAEVEDLEEQVIDIQAPTGEAVSVTLYKGTLVETKTLKSAPTAKVIANEDFFIDPAATTIDEAQYVIYKSDVTMSELRTKSKKHDEKNGIYDNVEALATQSDATEEDSNLSHVRETQTRVYGTHSTEYTGSARKKVTIYDYYGNYDLNGDGIAEPIVCTFSGNTVLRIGPNPFPDNKPPFEAVPFMKEGGRFWGGSLVELTEEYQRLRTAIMRTFIDTMANATNGLKHVEVGSINALNLHKLKQAKIGDTIMWKKIGGYKRDEQVQLPSSFFNVFELLGGENENESGVTKYNQGIDSKSLNKTATGITAILNQSQMRTWETITRYSEFLNRIFRKFIAYNKEWLPDGTVFRLTGDDVSFSSDDMSAEFDIDINVAAAGSTEQKQQQILMLIQQVSALVEAQVIYPTIIQKLLEKLFDLFGFKELAKELKDERERSEAEQAGVNGEPNTGDGSQGVGGMPQPLGAEQGLQNANGPLYGAGQGSPMGEHQVI